MTIALAAVAVLASAANIIGEKSASLIRTQRTVVREAPHNSIVLARPPLIEAATPVDSRPKEFAAAIDRFQHAMDMRVQIASALNDAEYSASGHSLLQLAAESFKGAAPGSGRSMKAARRAKDFVKLGDSLIGVAEERRQAYAGYLRSLDALNTDMQKSLDSAWKIMGRVIARQSLLQLRADLDAIRERSENLRSSQELPDLSSIAALANSETVFQETLTRYQSSLARSQGSQWVQQTQEDFSTLVSLRKQLISLGTQYDDSVRNVAKERAALWSAAASAYTADNEAAPRAAEKESTGALRPTHAISAMAPDARIPDTEVTSETATDRHARDILVIVTILTLLVTAIVCILTVRSIILPVRRFLAATTALARGHGPVHVAPGGIRELDTLARAFNEMATQLEHEQLRTRRQNETLEAKVTERTRQLQKLAEQDPLTSLPNRRHLQALLSDALGNAARGHRFVGVYFVDIDNFKNFNDSLGHVFGDRVLMSVANRLEELIDGRGFVARLGGDEFTVVYEDAPSVEAITELGSQMVNAFHRLLLVDEREFSVSLSVGASVFPEHDTTADGLLRAADSALFRAKESGRSQLVVFTSEFIQTAEVRFATEQGLRRAIDRQEFVLVYQPEVNLKTLEIGLVEALLRWRRPDGHLARPGEFLAVAEQSGLMSEINEWVLHAAVADAARWHHGGWPDVRVAINVSPRQLLDHRFTENLLSLLDHHRLPARHIELELTETVLQTGPSTIDTLRVLRSHGFGIALDDFGTGYSSITSLQELPLSRVKLDRSLIANIDGNERASVITRAIIELCNGLGLEVTAEGIERQEQLSWLLKHSPIFLQGYLLSHAVPFAEIPQVKDLMPNKMQDLLLSASPTAAPDRGDAEALRERAVNRGG